MASYSGYEAGYSSRKKPVGKTPEKSVRPWEQFNLDVEKAIDQLKKTGKAQTNVTRLHRNDMVSKIFDAFPDNVTVEEKEDWKNNIFIQKFVLKHPVHDMSKEGGEPTSEHDKKFKTTVDDTVNHFIKNGRASVYVDANTKDQFVKEMFNRFDPDEILFEENYDSKTQRYRLNFTKTLRGDKEIRVGRNVAVYWGRNPENEPIFFTGNISAIDNVSNTITVSMYFGKEEVMPRSHLKSLVLLTKFLGKKTPYTMSEITPYRIIHEVK